MASKSLVCSLYRKSLKTALSWADGRAMWRITALNLRDAFEANRHVTDPRQLRVLLQRTEEELEKWKHPDPYIPPTAPGGSKYERNIPAPILERMLPGSVLS
ncbi:putative NADH dehydrogenase [Morchella conica CCBAS932]|uniref:NADH dehydrogenase [ubiquinone] 1 beta subcomplex subunit 9 n=1 Tax=Morchella conica CCBAS932 TaxID=1392247 RepID=A0A3N4KJS7_9PEZI|nr:putative NADH dehydrogenase [Morchella conica CCBAS932]